MKHKNGIMVDGSLPSAGVTFYTRKGHTVIRAAKSHQPKRCTLKQFTLRERLSHNNSLWHVIRNTELITRPQFYAVAAKLPAVYLTREEHFGGFTLLMPGVPVACGTLPDVGCRLGRVDGTAALLTDLTPATFPAVRGERLQLVTVRQVCHASLPHLTVAVGEVGLEAFTLVDGRLALVDAAFGDADGGWALVRRRGAQCSSQRLVTAATAYLAYTTPAALQRAADSYGGLTG